MAIKKIPHHGVPAGKFKTHCLGLLEEVRRSRQPIIITKYGKPIAKLMPCEVKSQELFADLQGMVTIHGDIVAPLEEAWDASR